MLHAVGSLSQEGLQAFFDTLPDEDLVQYYHTCLANNWHDDHAAVRHYYKYLRFRHSNSLPVTPQNADFLRDELMPIFGDDILNRCEVVHLILDDVSYVTNADLRSVTRFCNISLKNASEIRTLKVTGRFYKEKDLQPVYLTMTRLRTIDKVYFDCSFGTDNETGINSYGAGGEYWAKNMGFWNGQGRIFRFYFNMAKLSPDYIDVLADVAVDMDNVEIHFY